MIVTFDFNRSGFPLLGGRVDDLGGRKTAVLIYQRRNHLISLFILPIFDILWVEQENLSYNDYNLVSQHHGGFEYWAVSDLSEDELKQFLFRFSAE